MLALPVAGSLPASRTHAARRWTFLAAADETTPSLGVLTIVQGRKECDSYGVAVEGSQILLAKLDAEADVYGVACPPAGHPVHCTCRGFAKTRRCKHVDAVREMRADGVLPAVNPAPDPVEVRVGLCKPECKPWG